MTLDLNSIIERNLKANGAERQVEKLIEEMGELTTALMKYRHGESTEDDVKYEIADVYITLMQVHMIFGDVDKHIDFKINRLEERLNNGSPKRK